MFLSLCIVFFIFTINDGIIANQVVYQNIAISYFDPLDFPPNISVL